MNIHFIFILLYQNILLFTLISSEWCRLDVDDRRLVEQRVFEVKGMTVWHARAWGVREHVCDDLVELVWSNEYIEKLLDSKQYKILAKPFLFCFLVKLRSRFTNACFFCKKMGNELKSCMKMGYQRSCLSANYIHFRLQFMYEYFVKFINRPLARLGNYL